MTEFNFSEREDFEAGFAQVYARDIVPYLREMEEKRKRAIVRSQRIIAVIAALSLYLAWRAYQLDPLLPIMPIAVGGFASLFFYISRGDKLQGQLTDFIRPILGNFMGDVSYQGESSSQDVQLSTLQSLCLVPEADRYHFGPRISGKWRDVSYQLVKASFVERYRDQENKQRSRTLFSGVLVEIECWNPMPSIVFLPDFGKLGNKMYSWATRNQRPPPRLDLSEDLEDMFEVYTDDPTAATKALGTAFGRKILDMSKDLQGSQSHISTAFQGSYFFMAVRLDHGFMNFDVMNRPLSEVDEKIHQAFQDLTIPRRIIDQLLD